MANPMFSTINPTITIVDTYKTNTPTQPTLGDKKPTSTINSANTFSKNIKKMSAGVISMKTAKQINSWIGSYTEDSARQQQVGLALNIASVIGTAVITGNPMALMALPVMGINKAISYDIKAMKIDNGADYVKSLTGGTWNGGR